jgi:hypothetical protein
MKKRFGLAAVAASFILLGLPFCDWAAPRAHAEDHHEFSAEDKAAFTDARIAALKAGLKLTPSQEKNWPALETVLRDVAKTRFERMADFRQKAKERQEHPNLIEGLRDWAKVLSVRAGELDKIADAAKPVYDSLDDAQKHRLRILLHAIMGMHGHMGHMSAMGHMGGDTDEHEDRSE